MERIDVVIVLIAALALAAMAWARPLDKLPFWLFLVLCAAFYPVGAQLFTAMESAAGNGGTWAEWTFTISVDLLFATLVASAVQGVRSFRGTRADRPSDHQGIDA
ncbi:hypothetical protein [Streptomyces sp. NPDC058330]|uniref:hypothetical protein n=1 Tax=Streptomyces sp. NPDC058330 TaxID=3346449 RepID=UPI0036E1F1F3